MVKTSFLPQGGVGITKPTQTHTLITLIPCSEQLLVLVTDLTNHILALIVLHMTTNSPVDQYPVSSLDTALSLAPRMGYDGLKSQGVEVDIPQVLLQPP
jgi:hypothetical protein